jgi:hypothetical protein
MKFACCLLAFFSITPLLFATRANPPLNQPCSACHTGSAPDNPGRLMIQVQALHYTPGVQQEVVLHLLSQRLAAAAGFRMSATLASNPAVQAGTFTPGQWSEVVPQNGLTVIQHSQLVGTNEFTFHWTPPATDVGPVRFSVEAVVGEWSTPTPDPNVYTGEYVMQRATRDLPAGFRRTAITIPGGTNVSATAISNNGSIAGTVRFGDQTRGFFRSSAGALTYFDSPAEANALAVNGVNDSGVVVGKWEIAPGQARGFVRLADNTVNGVHFAGATSTHLKGINNAGKIVGTLVDAAGSSQVVQTSVATIPNFTLLTPGAAAGISESGVISGGANRAGFLLLNDTMVGYKRCGGGIRGGGVLASVNDALDLAVDCFEGYSGGFVDTYSFLAPNGRQWVAGTNSIQLYGMNNSRQTLLNGYEDDYLLTPCEASPATTTIQAPGVGGTFPIQVNTNDPECRWIGIGAFSGGPGPGISEITVPPNPTSAPRSYTVFLAGSVITINQAGVPCTYILQGGPATFPATGGAGTMNVTAPPGCQWTPTSSVGWLQATGGGTGSGQFQFTVAANNGTQTRTAALTVGSSQFAVIQSGAAACTYDVFPASLTMPGEGGTAILNVTTGDGCAWTSTTTAAWLSPANASGVGSGQVTFTAAANNAGAGARASVILIAGRAVNVTQQPAGSLSSALRFVPITPCRLADTRAINFALLKGETRQFAVHGLPPCNIPATAQAYSLNITVVPPGYLGYLTAFPAGVPRPLASTLNSWNGRVVANASIVPAGTGGAIAIYADDPTHVIIDINGYFVLPNVPDGLVFYPLTPCRIADTRGQPRPAVIGPFTQSFAVRGGTCGVPAEARAYAMNVTVVPERTVAFVTVWPTGQPQPLASTLNSFDGQVVPNLTLVPAGTNGEVSLYATDTADFVLDVTGYFALPGSQPGGLSYRPLTPCRVSDTRSGPIVPLQTSREFGVVTAGCGVPASARAVFLNATAVPPDYLGFVTVWPSGFAQPLASTLNSWNGQVVANGALVPLGLNGAVSAYVSNATHLVLDVGGYFEP